ncbi:MULTISPECIES: phage tail fiber protein [Agrobacterium]|uniref:phage tail fiber domain-containing protein n=1 Tax=Agrobacterium TaxID=357 RepID=UPI0015739427|nr:MULTISPECIES: phage tail fiber protein [Agrobacterium]MDH0613326.1 phage tail fiber protein [Agrobacterium sp. GD03872]MDH0697243.1 phage tail fiber protein [Agrobacterium sp. GD03871]MDH1062176.1 phage tail fiber protein [Agrobacterium sp. GD03992]MDH2211350.1 phage tail fiber protein [Agrobacterium sp. GD03643]MDH2220609.1 phage tail fiber protein [Agrobacterium sp. GD03638]
MPLAYAQSLGDGVTRVFSVPFPYISKTHVQVRVEGAIVPYSWLSETSIQLATAPAVNAVVDRRRVTPRDTLLVDFVDGSTLVESDLDLSALQVFYLAQEAFDLGEASLGVTEDGSFSALNRRISNVLNPVHAQDVATKNFVETGVTSQVAIATQKANEAANSAGQSEASATNSAQQAAAALASKNAAAGSATAAAQSEANAIANKNQTQLDRAATAADRVQTGLDREASAASAAAAKKSAEDAASFDPATYYTKVQIDGSFYTKTVIDTMLGGYATTGTMNTALGQKVSKAGDTMTGALNIVPPSNAAILELRAVANAACIIDFSPNGYTGDYNWRVQAQPNNNEFDVFHNGTHRFRIRNDGHIWASAYGWLSDRFSAKGGRPYHDGGLWEFGSIDPQYADRSADAPSPYVLVGLRASRGSNIVYLRAIQLRNND